MEKRTHGWLGKYKELLAAITLFLVLDLGVLVFNTFTSHLIERDTALINTAGELRVYSQQLTKSLLTLRQEMQASEPIQSSLAELGEAHAAFTSALGQLRQAGQGSGLWRAPMDSSGQELLTQLDDYWGPIGEAAAPLLDNQHPAAMDVDGAVTKAVSRNVRLMQLADDLTRHLEEQAVSRAAWLRYIQVGAILLATLNFIFIVFKFIRRLLESDRQAESARRETRDILDTVREGLFLLGRDGRIGRQFSRSLPSLFGLPLQGGQPLEPLLQELLEEEQHEAARDYMDLLFNRKVKPALLEELNPLREVALKTQEGRRKGPSHLAFEFTQVQENGEVSALLVTVTDISRQMQLARELAVTEARAGSEVESLLAVLDQDPEQVRDFLQAGDTRLNLVNQALQDVKPDTRAYAELINQVFRGVHSIKGEAGALGLMDISAQAHQFEDLLTPLRRRHDLTGDDLIPIAFQVGELREKLARVQAVLARVNRQRQTEVGASHPFAELKKQIEHLALKVAEDLNKKVRIEVDFPSQAPDLDERLLRNLREMLPQLVRNAVAHGIEAEEERLQAGKFPEGTVRVEFLPAADGSLSLSVRDDGRGISCARIRARLLELGHTPERVQAMSEKELLACLFTPGFSLLEKAHEHAGRGVGLDLIRDMAARAGARLRLSTLPNTYTQFTLQFQPAP